MQDFGIIYCARNIINNKRYIGQTTQKLSNRIKGHKYDAKNKDRGKTYFYKAIRKYGFNFFEWKILEKNIKINELNEKETYWIKHYDTVNNGYNCMYFDEYDRKIVSKETRKKQSLIRLGKKLSKETCKKMSDSKKGTILGNKNPMKRKEVREKVAMKKIGKKMPKESREKLSKSLKEYYKKVKEKGLFMGFKTFHVYSPCGIKYIIKDGLKKFCKEQNLSYSSMRKLVGNLLKINNHQGWRIYLCKTSL